MNFSVGFIIFDRNYERNNRYFRNPEIPVTIEFFLQTRKKTLAGRYMPHVASASIADKALAMREGLALANRVGCNCIIVEGDSLETMG